MTLSRTSQKAPIGVLMMATVGFCVLLASKDMLFRVLALGGMSSGQILFMVGVGCGTTCALIASLTRTSTQLRNKRLQMVRFLVAGMSGYFIAEAFRILNASSVAMVSKIYIPLLLIASPLIGISYSRTQRGLALASVGAIAAFAVFTRQPGVPLAGYAYTVIAALLVMIEYITLRRTALTENQFWTAATPSVSCLAFGLLTAGPTHILQLHEKSGSAIAISLLAGVILYLIYAVSIHRYRLLPLGISEYPSLVTALILLPIELKIYGGRPDPWYVACLLATTFLMALTIYFRDHSQVIAISGKTA